MSVCTICQTKNLPNARFCSNCGRRLDDGRVVRKLRKPVTVLFTDVVDSTALGRQLDAEPLNQVLQRFFDRARQILEAHGGVVQRYFGDAVMAVFGLPRVQTDDAFRSVRSAVELHEAMRPLNQELSQKWGVELVLHTAISTGEVVVDEGETTELPVASDHINRLAGLLRLADPDVTLISNATYQLVRGSVKAEPVHAPGVSDDGPAFKVLEVSDQQGAFPRFLLPLIGRRWELDFLRLAYDGVLQRRMGSLVSVLGDAGIGKTRLVDEFLRDVSRRPDRKQRPLVLRGVCLRPSAESTYYPIRQMLRHAAGIRADDSSDKAKRQLAKLVEGDEGLMTRLAPFIGLPGQVSEPEDTIRAICRTLSIMARRTPLVLVVDDLHWAEQPMLDILQQAKDALTDASVLLVAVSRSDLFDETRDWSSWVRNTLSLSLAPLNRGETEQMIEQMLLGAEPDPAVVTAIADRTGGSPLDVEVLMTGLLDENVLRQEEGRWVLAGDLDRMGTRFTANAAFTARIELLRPTERLVAQRAAVVGAQFRFTDVQAVIGEMDAETIAATLVALVRKELLKLDPEAASSFEPGDERYTFRHVRHQQAAYDLLPIEDRAVTHEEYSAWLEQHDDGSPTMAERIAYHLRYAYDGVTTVRGEDAERSADLARRAGEWYARAARRFISHGSFPVPSVKRALGYALRFFPEGKPAALRAQLDLADTLQEPEPATAREIYDTVVTQARKAEERVLERHAALGRLELAWFLGDELDYEQDRLNIEEWISDFETLGGEAGTHLMAKAYRLLANAYAALGAAKDALVAADRALELITRTSDTRLHAKIVRMRLLLMFWGPTPIEEVVREVEQAVAWARREGLFSLETAGLGMLARAAVWRGDFALGRRLNTEARQVAAGLPDLLTLGTSVISEATVELLASDLEAAERTVRRGLELLERKQAYSTIANLSALLARILLTQGDDRAAERAIEQCRKNAMPAQSDAQIKWRQLRGQLLARRGQLDEGEALCRDAVERSRVSQQPVSQAEALYELADVLRMQGKFQEAKERAAEALALYRQKGYALAARITEQLLTRLATATG